jgi:hypothetical protein
VFDQACKCPNSDTQKPDQTTQDDALVAVDPDVQALIDNVVKTAIWSEFIAYFEEMCKRMGTMFSRSSKNMSAQQFVSMFPDREFASVVGRGFLYCKVNKKHGVPCAKSENAVDNKKSKCEWTIHFRIDVEKRVYVIDPKRTNVRHSHAVNRDAIRTSFRRLITYEKEMTVDEIACVKEFTLIFVRYA